MMSPSQDSATSGDYFDPSFLQEKLKRIQHLESELESARGKDQHVRIRLCEIYSGCFLRNPAFAYDNNFLDRLWRNCFYQRIGDERKEISRRKRKNVGSVTQATATFHRFLEEAMVLYGYLVKFYLTLVSPQETSQQGSQSYDLSQEDLDEEGKEAVVAVLHRFEIYLGDLHRYREQFQDAASHYERAAMLAPGQGNPYNQLAVLEQLKDSACNALYWYARSIRASSKPFETSLSNVERLYQSNRKWLMENPEGSVGVPTKKAGADLVRARKSAASKRFTANFVDLQLQLRAMEDPNVDKQQARKFVLENMDAVITNLESFLSSNGLSDTLLCRMVVINAFTVSQYDVALANVLVLRFGTALAERADQGIKKILDTSPDNPPAIRGLSPLLLTCDYVSHFESNDEDFVVAEEAFWSKVCSVATKVKMLLYTFRLKDADIKGKLPKEYTDLIGFTPFETFIDKPHEFLSIEDAKKVVPFLPDPTPTYAKKLSQESLSSSLDARIKLAHFLVVMESSPKVEQGMDGGGYRFSGETEETSYEDDAPAAFDDAQVAFDEPPMEDNTEPAADILQYKAPEHGAGPALLVPGALLFNKAAKSTPEHTGEILETSTDPIDEDRSTGRRSLMSALAQGTPAASFTGFPTPIIVASPVFQVAPPTGRSSLILPLEQGIPATSFTGFPTPIVAAPPVFQVAPPATPLPDLVSPPGLGRPPGLRPPPGFAPPTQNETTLLPPQNETTLLPPQNATTLLPPWDFLALQPTENPFFQQVTEYPVAQQASVDPNSFLSQDETLGLLDSSLLQSLWLDDAKQPLSKNPFLTGAK